MKLAKAKVKAVKLAKAKAVKQVEAMEEVMEQGQGQGNKKGFLSGMMKRESEWGKHLKGIKTLKDRSSKQKR
ncbi:hypothetical protein N9985_02870 [Gammaproteobacteria bacterium]|nr:hypothetical protein [Gammaproteobacteria bacterium]